MSPSTLVRNLTPGFNYISSGGLTLASSGVFEGQQHALMNRKTESDQSKAELEEHESKSGSDNMEGGSAEEQDPDQPPKKKRYHRHSVHQIQQMEFFFKECPHPDEKQRQQLSGALGLSSRQVKFWFQNRRTQLKSQQERQENNHLRAENERLRAENITMREAIKNASCPSCGGPSALGEMSFDEQRLAMENARLKDELDRISSIVVKYFGGRSIPPLASLPPIPSSSLELGVGSNLGLHHPGGPSGEILPGPSVADVALRPGGLSEREKPLVVELAVASLDELHRMARSEEPLWVKGPDGTEMLDYDAYLTQFPTGIGPRPFGLKTEASRETGLVIMNGLALVDALMDANKWMEMFSSIISKAVTVEVLSPGMGGTRDGALQLMYAELQVLTPLVGGREVFFLRYCKQTADDSWVVVDVSVDSLRENPPPSLLRCRRRPSGCLVQDMPNGYAQVTWVEHVEADDRVASRIFRPLISSTAAFGAKRWVANLQRHCESLASLLATNIPARELGVIPSPEGRSGMLRLAQRMTNSFCSNVSAASSNSWVSLPNVDDNIRVMSRDNAGNGVLCAATSLWLPFPRHRVFNFLRDERFRAEWDVLTNGPVQEMCHIAKGQHPGNSVSLLRVNASNPNQTNVLFVQESCTDASCSLVVYAPLDFTSLNLVLQGEDPSSVLIIPSGFVVLPDGPENKSSSLLLGEGSIGIDSMSSGGSILTVFFQIAVSHLPSSARFNIESVSTVSNVIINTVQNIKAFLQRRDF